MVTLKKKIIFGAVLSALSLQALAVGSIASVTVFDRSANRELPVYSHQGRYYVVGTPGNEYQIQIQNQSPSTVLAVTSVDGVNVVSGKTASFNQGGYLVNPWNNTSIAGWRKNMGETASFYFTSLGDSYAGRTSRPSNVGVIGVAIFRQKLVPPPFIINKDKNNYDERSYERKYDGEPRSNMQKKMEAAPSAPSSLGEARTGGVDAQRESSRDSMSSVPMPSGPLGTGHGRREESSATYAEFKRESNSPNEVVSIYYDSYDNLVNKGVIPRYRHRPQNNQPNAFPDGFVPDPRR